MAFVSRSSGTISLLSSLQWDRAEADTVILWPGSADATQLAARGSH